jgi:hypothetical protein
LGIIKAFSISAIQAKTFLLYSFFGGGLGSNIWAILLKGDFNLAFFKTFLSYLLPIGFFWLKMFNTYFEMNEIPLKEMYTIDGIAIFFMLITLVIKEVVTSKKLVEMIEKKFGCIKNPKYKNNLKILFKIYLFLYMLFLMISTFYFKFHMISWIDARQLILPYLIFIIGFISYFLLSKFNNNNKRHELNSKKEKNDEEKKKAKLRMKRILTITISLQIQNTGLTFVLVTLNNLPFTQNLELLSIFATIPLWFVLLVLAIKYLKKGFSRKDDEKNKGKETDEISGLMKNENATTSKEEA